MDEQEKNRLLAALLLKLVIPATIALLLSILMTVLNYGLGADFLRNWVKSFVVALVVIPLALRAHSVGISGGNPHRGNQAPGPAARRGCHVRGEPDRVCNRACRHHGPARAGIRVGGLVGGPLHQGAAFGDADWLHHDLHCSSAFAKAGHERLRDMEVVAPGPSGRDSSSHSGPRRRCLLCWQ